MLRLLLVAILVRRPRGRRPRAQSGPDARLLSSDRWDHSERRYFWPDGTSTWSPFS